MNREVVIVLGKTGYGKSLFTKLLLQPVQRKLIYDPSMTIETNYGTSQQVAEELIGSQENLAKYANQPFSFGIWDAQETESLGALSFLLQNNWLVLEEVSSIFEKGARNLPLWAKRLIFFGRHRQCSMILVAQRATSIPIDFRTQANRIVTFQQHEGDDISWLKGFFGRMVEDMPFLSRWTCLDYHNGQVIKYSIRDRVQSQLGIRLQEPTDSVSYGLESEANA